MTTLLIFVCIQIHLGYCEPVNRPFNWTAWHAENVMSVNEPTP